MPIKVGPRGPLKNQQKRCNQLKQLLEQLKKVGFTDSAKRKKNSRKLAQLQYEIDRILGRETGASVDSELSMVLFDDYELYRWQPNKLKDKSLYFHFRALMVCRLDGPGAEIAKGLVDKAITAERTGLKGTAYIDSRGLADDKNPHSFGCFDQSLRDLALLTRFRTQLPVKHEQTEKLFKPGTCPNTAIYCGWYSLRKYIDAFDFTDGAIGYHISSFEAVDLRDPNSTQWCPAMLTDGVTATLGPVAEPYLSAFPKPKELFLALFNGDCLVEAYYQTKPFNSWQLVLIGDPLYRPFKKP